MKTNNFIKKTLIVIAAIIAIFMVGLAGELDHHEYIEANLRIESRMDD